MKKRIMSILLVLSMLCPMLPSGGFMTTSAQASNTQTAQEAFGFSTDAPAVPATGDPYGSMNGLPVNINVLSELFVATTRKQYVDYALFDWDNGSAGTSDSSTKFATDGTKNKQAFTATTADDDAQQSAARIVAFDPYGSGKDEYIARHVMSYGYDNQKSYHQLQVIKASTGKEIASIDLKYPSISGNYLNARDIEGLIDVTAGDFDGDGCDEIAICNAGTAYCGMGDIWLFEVNGNQIAKYAETDPHQYISKSHTNGYDAISFDRFVGVQLTAGQLVGDSAHEDLVVTLNTNSTDAADSGENGSRVLVYSGESLNKEDATGDAPIAPVAMSDFFQNIGEGDESNHDLRAASTSIGDVDFDNKPDLIVAGRFSINKNQEIYNDDKDIDQAYMAVFDINEAAKKLVHKPNNKWKLYDTVNQRIHYAKVVQPVALTAFAADGKSAADSVFMDGAVFKYSSAGVFEEHSDGATASWNKRHNDGRDDCNFIDQAIAGNMTNDPSGREMVIFTYGSRDGGNNDRDLGIGSMFYNAEKWEKDWETMVDCGSLGSLAIAAPDTGNDGILVRPREVNGETHDYYFTDPKIIAVLQAAPRFDELDVEDDNYQADGHTLFGSSEGSSSGSSNTIDVSAGASVGVEFKASILGFIPVGGFESTASITMNFSQEFAREKAMTKSITYESSSDADRVALTMIPYTRYYYEMYMPAFQVPSEWEYKQDVLALEALEKDHTEADCNKMFALAERIKAIEDAVASGTPYESTVEARWQKYEVSIPAEPRTTMITVDRYDSIAQDMGWVPLRGTILPDGYEIGNPESYLHTNSGLEHWDGGSTADTAGGLKEGFVGLPVGGGAIAQTIEMENSTSKATSFGTEIAAEVIAGLTAAKVGVSTSLGNENGFTWTDSSGATYEGSVRGVPEGRDNYSFNWQFGTYTVPYDYDNSGEGYDCRVLGYLVKDMKAPPSVPVNFEAQDVEQNSLKLTWEPGLRPAEMYTIYSYTEGAAIEYFPLVTLDGSATEYTVEGLLPDRSYSYAIRSQTLDVPSVYSQVLTARTAPVGGTFAVTATAEGIADNMVTVNPGGSIALTAAVDVDGSYCVVQWRKQSENGKWVDIPGATSFRCQLNDLTYEDSGKQYRCVVTQMIGGYQITQVSNIITVEVGKKPSTVTMDSLTSTSGQASYTPMKEVSTTINTDVNVVATIGGTDYDVLKDDTENYYLKKTTTDQATGTSTVRYYQLDGTEKSAVDTAIGADTVVDGKITLSDEITLGTAMTPTYRFNDASGAEIAHEKQLSEETEKNESITIDGVAYSQYKEATLSSGQSIISVVSTDNEPRYYLRTVDGETTYASLIKESYYGTGDGTEIAMTPVTKTYTITKTEKVEDTENPVTGTPVTLSAAVSNAQSGQVTFHIYNTTDKTTHQISVDVDDTGKATTSWTPASPGRYEIKASFDGNSSLKASTSENTVSYQAYGADESQQFLSIDGATTMTYGESGTYAVKLYDAHGTSTTPSNMSCKIDGAPVSNFETALEGKTPGTYTLFASCTEAGKEYIATKTVTVAKKTITVTADDGTKEITDTFAWGELQNEPTTAFTISESITDGTANVFSRSYTLPKVLGTNYVIAIHWNDEEANSAAVKEFQSKYDVKFVAGKYNVTGEANVLTFSAGMNGTLSASDAKGILRASGANILANTVVTLTAYPEPGYKVKGWTVDGVAQSSLEKNLTVTMDDDKAVAVTFTPTTSTLSYGVDTTDSHGSVTADYYDPTTYQTEGSFNSGDSITANNPIRFVATPESGYVVSEWEITRNGQTETVLNIDGKSHYTLNTFLLESVTETATVTVHFAEKAESTITVKIVDETGKPFSGVGVDFIPLEVPGTPTAAVAPMLAASANAMEPSLTNTTFCQHDNVNIVLDVPVGVTVRDWSGIAYVAAGKQSAKLFDLDASQEITITCSASNHFQLAFGGNAGGTITAHEVYVDGSVSATELSAGASYPQGTKIQFTMTPNGGYGLSNLVVNDETVTATKAGDAYTYVTTLRSDLTATATFAQGHVVTYNQIPGATYSFVLNGATTELVNGAVIPVGSQLTATLTPDSGLVLASLTAGNVSDDIPDANGALSITLKNITADVAIEATTPIKHTITLGDTLTADGVTTVIKVGDTTISDGDTVMHGADVTLEITPKQSHVVTEIDGTAVNDAKANGTITHTISGVTADVEVNATFTAKPVVTIEATENGAMMVRGTINGLENMLVVDGKYVDFHSNLTVAYAPAVGYEVVATGGETMVAGTGDDQSYTKADVTADVAISDYFVAIPATTLHFSVNDVNGTLTASVARKGMESYKVDSLTTGAPVYRDSVVTFTADLDDGYTIEGWYRNGVKVEGEAGLTYSFGATANTGEVVIVKIIRKSYTLTFSAENGTITAQADGKAVVSGDALKGDTAVTFTTTPNTGYVFRHWLVDDVQQGALASHTMTADVTIKAVFGLPPRTITFDANGGTALTNPTATTDGAGKLTTLPTPTRDGFIFQGWYTAASSGTKITTETVFDANVTIYAQWTEYTTGPVGPAVGGGVGGGAAAGVSYEITVDVDGKGTVTPDGGSEGKEFIAQDGSKLFTFAPNAGYYIADVLVNDKSVGIVKSYEFEQVSSDQTLKVIFASIVDTWKNPYIDVHENDWFYGGVAYVSFHGLMNGTSANTFSPDMTTTRGMLMTVLARNAGIDTTGGEFWYSKGMNWTKAEGVSDGTNPEADLTREQMVTMLWRTAGEPKATGDMAAFTDVNTISAYAVSAMGWAVENRIIQGMTTTTLSPQDTATRAQFAVILERYLTLEK